MSTYFINRSGKGTSIERRKAYKYQSLAAGYESPCRSVYRHRREPKNDDEPMQQNSHNGQNLILYLKVVCFLYRRKRAYPK